MDFKNLGGNYLIRLKRGEKIVATLEDFFKKQKIQGGFFFGIGAVDSVELAHYDVRAKKYSTISFNLPLEMTSLIGNIGIFNKQLIIHAHATFSDKKMQPVAGHLVEATISGTGEIFFIKTRKLEKFFDQETGLKLFHL